MCDRRCCSYIHYTLYERPLRSHCDTRDQQSTPYLYLRPWLPSRRTTTY